MFSSNSNPLADDFMLRPENKDKINRSVFTSNPGCFQPDLENTEKMYNMLKY
jgi:hypothetical protein